MAKKLIKGKDYFVNHHMRDGRILDSIEGYKVPINEKTKIAYDILAGETIKASKTALSNRK